MSEVTPKLPFRWDLARREQLGGLVGVSRGVFSAYGEELERCAARVLARAGDSDLYFVGRSVETLFDYLSGALLKCRGRSRLRLLPFSMREEMDLSRRAIAQLRANLHALDLAPAQLARRKRKVAFIDLVYRGGTFANLITQLHTWVEEEGRSWPTVKAKVRLVGITSRTKTSPKTWRWQQHADFAKHLLPRRAIVNVSLDAELWSYFGNYQHKVSESFPAWRWDRPPPMRPRHDASTLAALAEAVAYFDRGRDPESRERMLQVLRKEPMFREPWLRSLALQL